MASQALFFILVGVGVVLSIGIVVLLIMRYVRSAKADEAKPAPVWQIKPEEKPEIAPEQFETGDWKSASVEIRKLLAKAEEEAKRANQE
jgi:hypothetical protein